MVLTWKFKNTEDSTPSPWFSVPAEPGQDPGTAIFNLFKASYMLHPIHHVTLIHPTKGYGYKQMIQSNFAIYNVIIYIHNTYIYT